MGSVSRVSVKRSLSHILNCCSYANILVEAMNSALSIPQTFSYALDTFLEKTSCLFLPHLSNLAVRNEFTEFPFSACSRYRWNYCHFIFLVHVNDRK